MAGGCAAIYGRDWTFCRRAALIVALLAGMVAGMLWGATGLS